MVQEGLYEINGVKYNIFVAGEGQPLVLLHGSYTNMDSWKNQIQTFSREYKVISYDQRGYGKSDIPLREFSYYEDVKNILDFLSIKKANFIASSFGSSVAIDFTLMYPEYVQALVLVGAATNGYKYPARMKLECILDYFRAKTKGIEYAAKKFERNKYWDYFIPREDEKRKEFMEIYKSNSGFYQWQQNLHKPLMPLAISQLEKIKVPTLLIEGENDQAFNKKASELISGRITGSEKIVVKDSGHLPYVEKSQEFNDVALCYLKKAGTNQLMRVVI